MADLPPGGVSVAASALLKSDRVNAEAELLGALAGAVGAYGRGIVSGEVAGELEAQVAEEADFEELPDA